MVGAGPGDAGLLTLKGAARVRSADVVLYDRFVGDEILAMIPEGAEKIDVGKRAGDHPVPQGEINRLLLEKAASGLNVVRLKGGDPFVFGRGGEELELLAENGVPFEVIPGVTSATAAAAYAGIPVTHRDYASSFHVITGRSKRDEPTDIDYAALVRLTGGGGKGGGGKAGDDGDGKAGGTLVFLMGVAVIGDICAGLIGAGIDGSMPAAIVENATTYAQRKFIGTVATLPSIAKDNAAASPAVIIIGEVCRLSERYDWFGGKPLLGRHIIVARAKSMPDLQVAGEPNGAAEGGPAAHAPATPQYQDDRGAAYAYTLPDKLRELGCRVTEMPGAKFIPLTGPGSPLEQAILSLDGYAWLVFTSGAGVGTLFDYLMGAGIDVRRLCHLKIACVGRETEKELNRRGLTAAYRPEEYNGAALASGLSEISNAEGGRLLVAGAKDGAEDLTRILSERAIPFDYIAVYDKVYDTEQSRAALEKIKNNIIDYAAFTSSSAVDAFARSAGYMDMSGLKAVCIGRRTAATAASYGMEVFISDEATIDSMIKKIKELCV